MSAPPALERAGTESRAEIEALLAASGLPLDGLDAALDLAVVVRAPDGTLAGCAGVETHSPFGLLRSVAVVPERRGTGLGRALVEEAERLGAERGLVALYLLTETAAGWFPRLGYAQVDRATVPPEVAASVEFATACPVSAVAMRKELGTGQPTL